MFSNIRIPLILLVYCVTKTNLLVFAFLLIKGFLSVAEWDFFDVVDDLIMFVSSLSLCTSLYVIFLKLVHLSLYGGIFLFRPWLLPLWLKGGGKMWSGHKVVCFFDVCFKVKYVCGFKPFSFV